MTGPRDDGLSFRERGVKIQVAAQALADHLKARPVRGERSVQWARVRVELERELYDLLAIDLLIDQKKLKV